MESEARISTPALGDPFELGVPNPSSAYPPPPRPIDVEAARGVAWGEIGEPLDKVRQRLQVKWVYEELGLDRRPDTLLLRRGVLARLVTCQARLEKGGFGLVVLDGWRSVDFQNAVLAYYAGRTKQSLIGFVASTDDPGLMAPHTTGGAVDLTLSYRGTPLALGTDYDDFSSHASLLAMEQHNPGDEFDDRKLLARALRRLLASALCGVGFAPYDVEWWHWSFGDQRWAAQYGYAHTLYSPIEP